MSFLKKLLRSAWNRSHGNKSVDGPSSYHVVVDDSPETAKKQVNEILGVMDRIEESHRGEYVVMHTTVPQELLSQCQNDVTAVQDAFDAPFHEHVVDLGMIDFRSFKHLSVNASGDEGVVALAIHGKTPLNVDYAFSSNWHYKKQPTSISSREVKKIHQVLATLNLKKFCKEHAISRSDVWVLESLSERYRQASENDLAMVSSCRSER
jgi:hypothetical protein